MKAEFDQEEIKMLAYKIAEILTPLVQADRLDKNDEILTIDEAAKMLKTNKARIYQLVNNSQHGLGDFPFFKFGNLLRFSKHAILRWLQKHSNLSENR